MSGEMVVGWRCHYGSYRRMRISDSRVMRCDGGALWLSSLKSGTCSVVGVIKEVSGATELRRPALRTVR